MSPPKAALITGVTGQDGAYLAEFLLKKGPVVHGIKRSAAGINTSRVVQQVQPDETYTFNYHEAYGIYACNGVLFNHESPLRDGRAGHHGGLRRRGHARGQQRGFGERRQAAVQGR